MIRNRSSQPKIDKELIDIYRPALKTAETPPIKLTNEDKHTVFRQAYLTSNQLLAWNVPVRLNSISNKKLKKETQDRLFKHNLLDHYITQWLGYNAWNRGDFEKLTDEQCRELAQMTAAQYLFITKLEQDTERQGELKRILKEHQNKDMKELRELWEVNDETVKEVKEWSKQLAEKWNKKNPNSDKKFITE